MRRSSTGQQVDRERANGIPLFLRKQSGESRLESGAPGMTRERSMSSVVSPTVNGGSNGAEMNAKWAQELAAFRQHVNQHSSDMEIQISDIETALSKADIGAIKARLDALEENQRNKK